MKKLEDHGSETHPLTSLELSKDISASLSVSARKLRFSTSSRSNLYKMVGLRPRLIDRLFNVAIIVVTVACLGIPTFGSFLYFGFLASDQYESETRFTVRSSTAALGDDQMGNIAGKPKAKIVQDTQIVVSFITSHEILQMLENDLNFNEIYGSSEIDRIARLPEDATAEELLDYWTKMVSVSVSPSSGIVTVSAKAFAPEDSQLIVRSIMEKSEVVVNQVNDRIWRDVVTTAQNNLKNATKELQQARGMLANARNDNGILSVDGSSQLITGLIGRIEAELLALQQRFDTSLSSVSSDAPQMRVLRREIESKERQIAELNSRIASSGSTSRSLAQISTDLSQFELTLSLAESKFAASVKTLEQVQFISKQQLLYLDSFLEPRIPDEALFPRRGLWITLSMALGLVAWGFLFGLLNLVRSRVFH